MPSVPDADFRPVAFDKPAAQYRSHWCGTLETVTIEKAEGGLRAHVSAPRGDGKSACYVGVRFRVDGLGALRLSAQFIEPQNLERIFIDGCDRTARTTRWRWQVTPAARPQPEPQRFVLVPGKAAGYFQALETGDDAAIRWVDVFVRVRPGTQAGFVLRDVAIALVGEKEG